MANKTLMLLKRHRTKMLLGAVIGGVLGYFMTQFGFITVTQATQSAGWIDLAVETTKENLAYIKMTVLGAVLGALTGLVYGVYIKKR